MAGADVDDIWEQMQKEQQAARATKPVRSVVTKGVDLSALQAEKRRPKGKPEKKLDNTLQWMQAWNATLKPGKEVGVPVDALKATAGAPQEDLRMSEPPATLMDALDDIPTDTPETFLAYLQRDINCLSEETVAVRLQSLQKLERLLVKQADTLPTDVLDTVGDALLKPLLKRLKDKSEKCRDLAAQILRSLAETVSDLHTMLPYVFPVLVGRLGCEDLDGVAHLPEVARPDPEQKPTEIVRPVEESEEVRLQLAKFVATLLGRLSQTQVYSYVDEAAGLLRAGCMDPFHEIKAVACETMTAFCYNHHEVLLHFTEPLGRSLTSVLMHNHGRLRIAALRTITAVLHCGPFKHNHEVMQMLMAWQDPNKCPVKAFYEPMTNCNYMANLSFDRHPAVRRFWYETLGYWLLQLQDKSDHEPYIFPYLLTGLCDENEDIALETFWLIERCGAFYETEKEEDLRKTKQYGFDYGWTYRGQAFVPFPLQGVWGGNKSGRARRRAAAGPDMMGALELRGHKKRDIAEDVDMGEVVEIPARDYAWPELRDLVVYRNLPRPNLGARMWVRQNTRRYIKATFNDVVDFRDCTALNAGRLLCMTLAYTEEGVTEWLQPMVAAVVKFYSGRAAASGDSQCMQTYACVCKLTGTFVDPNAWWKQLSDALSPDSSLALDQRIASVKVLALCIEGAVEALDSITEDRSSEGLGRLDAVIPELIAAMHSSDFLLWPSDEARRAMWNLMFSFLESLHTYLSLSQVAQLLYVALSLAAKAPVEGGVDRAAAVDTLEALQMDNEELVDEDKLSQALEILSSQMKQQESKPEPVAILCLDDMDDGPSPSPEVSVPSSHADPRIQHQDLFRQAFPEVLACVDDSFQIFRSITYLSPLTVLASYTTPLLEKFTFFLGAASTPATKREGHALVVQLALRCCRYVESAHAGTAVKPILDLMRKMFQMSGKMQIEAASKTSTLSYIVIMSGLSMWRQFLLGRNVNARELLFPIGGEPSKPMQFLLRLVEDQELYKRFHAALERSEMSVLGKASRDDFIMKQTRAIREASDSRAATVRALAASTLLVGLRRISADGRGPIPWAPAKQPGSAAHAFLAAASLFRTAQPTIEPNFVRPTQPPMVLFAAELLSLMLRQGPGVLPSAFRLQDDAARAIHEVRPAEGAPQLPLELAPEEREVLVNEFVTTLVDLNLSLPPDPEAKHAPVNLGEGQGDEIILGWDAALPSLAASTSGQDVDFVVGRGRQAGCAGVEEVRRLLTQSDECLKWNAALALYRLGVDLSVLCEDGFVRCLDRWRKQRAQAKVLVTGDLLARAHKKLKSLK